jgi:hypothetical protein
MPKRLFDRRDVDAFFQEGWEILEADESATRRYDGEKVVREVAAKKTEGRKRSPKGAAC